GAAARPVSAAEVLYSEPGDLNRRVRREAVHDSRGRKSAVLAGGGGCRDRPAASVLPGGDRTPLFGEHDQRDVVSRRAHEPGGAAEAESRVEVVASEEPLTLRGGRVDEVGVEGDACDRRTGRAVRPEDGCRG